MTVIKLDGETFTVTDPLTIAALQVLVATFPVERANPCPFDFAHTKHWCGNEGCRDS